MINDLVTRLREGCGCEFLNKECAAENECRDAFEAANKIEELQEEINKLRSKIILMTLAAGFVEIKPKSNSNPET